MTIISCWMIILVKYSICLLTVCLFYKFLARNIEIFNYICGFVSLCLSGYLSPTQINPYPKFVNLWMLILTGKSIFTCINYLNILRGDHPGSPRWALNQKTNVLIRRRQKDIWHTDTHNIRPEAEIGDMLPQTKKYLQPPEPGRSKEGFFLAVLPFIPLACRTEQE